MYQTEYPADLMSKNCHDQTVHFREYQAHEPLEIMSHLSDKEGDNYVNRSDAVTAALRSYHTQSGVSSNDLDKAREALLTLTASSKRAFTTDFQKGFAELSRDPKLSLHMVLDDRIILQATRQQGLSIQTDPQRGTQSTATQRGIPRRNPPLRKKNQSRSKTSTNPSSEEEQGLEAKVMQIEVCHATNYQLHSQ